MIGGVDSNRALISWHLIPPIFPPGSHPSPINMATRTQEQPTLEGAKRAIAAAERKAKEIGVPMNVTVVDASTHLLHFSRMEGANITSISSQLMPFHDVELMIRSLEVQSEALISFT
jgi:hypothetical protein